MGGRPISVTDRDRAVSRVLAGASVAEAAAEVGASASTVRRWVHRTARGESLADRPRPGRPRIQDTAQGVVAAVLATAGARVDSADYSTRAVARATGLSQSVVSRVASGMSVEAREARDDEIVVFAVGFPVLVVGTRPVVGGARRTRSERALRRRASAVVAGVHASGVDMWADRFDSDHRQVRREDVATVVRGAAPARWVAYDPHGDLDVGRLPGKGVSDTSFGSFIGNLTGLLATVVDVPGSLLDLVAARAARGLEGLMWSPGGQPLRRAESTTLESFGLVPDSRWLPRENQSMTEQLAYALRQEIIDSGYRSGDRIRPTVLVHRLGVPRTAVDAALRRMVDDEILDGSRGGVRIPDITPTDVLDLYAARRSLGAILLRNLATRPKRHLVPVRQALQRVEAVSEMRRDGLTEWDEVENADLRFQQELARAAGLTQTSRAFESLTLRLRMYISVLRLDYGSASERIVYDDRRIFSFVERSDAVAAVRAWTAKVDNSVRLMSGIAGQRRFDVSLWNRLTTD
ncbi:helix-turn-helix domain-containing protein [Brevibacterium litoralis]|uniref:helix-turn-helix domain-containing protein n=1 Tax=Brevibacterium litoralis TaxID=3138935 RepID=UPI0032EB26C1